MPLGQVPFVRAATDPPRIEGTAYGLVTPAAKASPSRGVEAELPPESFTYDRMRFHLLVGQAIAPGCTGERKLNRPSRFSGTSLTATPAEVGEATATTNDGTLRVEADLRATRGVVNPKVYSQLEKQLKREGADTIHKALRGAEKALAKHEAKLPGLEFKSQVEGTIRNVKNQIETIKKFIDDKGL